MRKLAIVLAILLPCPALACSLCGASSRRVSLVQEFEQAQVAIYGHLANPKLTDAKTGAGTTEFHVDSVIKDAPGFPKQKVVTLSRFLPILDAKEPPRYVMFFQVPAKNNQPYTGRQIASPGVLHFALRLASYRDNPAEALRFAGKHLDDADAEVAEEAFLVFAKADDKHVNQAAKSVLPESLRKLIKTPDIEPERLSMYAYLLGASGDKNDVELLRNLLKDPSPRLFRAYEGILAGYITLQPKEGWAFAHETLKNPKSDFVLRYAVLRTLRFYYNADPEANAANVLLGESMAIEQPDVADVAIQDLMRWKRWDHTKLIVACYDRASHKSMLVKNSLVRYALACPQPEAKALVERVRRENPDLIKYLQEELK